MLSNLKSTLEKKSGERTMYHVKYGGFYANRKISNLTQNSEVVPKLVQNLMGPLQKHLKPYSLNILVIIFEKLVEIHKNVKP